MEWFYPKRRGPQWKQGWTGQTLTSISAPPLHLLTIFAIVIAFLWLSQYTDYKSQMQHTAINAHLFLISLPIFLIFLFASYSSISSTGWFNFGYRPSQREAVQRAGRGGSSSSPWGVAILLVLLLVLVSYQSLVHSKWFGGRSD
ncbi:PI-PLC X-box domain-containing protein [Pyrus ussuriensis x Pyrus communis]|uniref:PI-PLC X-box domain-containing protein n=1 Tax=Pyrus ussuriensis x Pyrus communis TaxID=2448454 RepID=A0A5N5IC49_9ROSA|nr:PI-PLC X-box domain-containing protein [Pyrus ussuriensis x Pyrus communis]